MKRKAFLQQSIGLGASIALIPHLGFSNGLLNIANMQLPEAIPQVRHGLFNLTIINHPFLPNWIKVFHPQQFLKNGFLASANDFKTFQARVYDQDIVIGYDNEQTMIQCGSDVLVTKRKDTFKHSAHPLEVTINDVSALASTHEKLLFVLDGKVSVNSEKLLPGMFLHANEKMNLGNLSEDTLFVTLKV